MRRRSGKQCIAVTTHVLRYMQGFHVARLAADLRELLVQVRVPEQLLVQASQGRACLLPRGPACCATAWCGFAAPAPQSASLQRRRAPGPPPQAARRPKLPPRRACCLPLPLPMRIRSCPSQRNSHALSAAGPGRSDGGGRLHGLRRHLVLHRAVWGGAAEAGAASFWIASHSRLLLLLAGRLCLG